MQSVRLFLSIFILGLLNNCYLTGDNKCELKLIQKSLEEDTVYLFVDITIRNNDLFRVYYIPEGENNFKDLTFVEKEVAGSNFPQTIAFEFPKSTYLSKVRLDVSEIRQHQSFEVHKVIFAYGKKCFDIEKQFPHFFTENKFLERGSSESNIFTTRIIDNKYDPHLLSKDLIEVMDYLLYKG